MQNEIVYEQVAIDENGIPQYDKAKERKSIVPIVGQLIAYGLFFFSLALSGA